MALNFLPIPWGTRNGCGGVTSQPLVYYFGATGGGVWKTAMEVSTGNRLATARFLAQARLARSACRILTPIFFTWAWENRRYAAMFHMATVCINPPMPVKPGNVSGWMTPGKFRVLVYIRVIPIWFYVAALGHTFGPNEQRGIFRSKDGGKTWERILIAVIRPAHRPDFRSN